MPGSIDIVVDLCTPDEVPAGRTGVDAACTTRVRGPAPTTGLSIDDDPRRMDRTALDAERAVAAMAARGLRPDARDAVVRGDALRVCKS